MVCPGFNEPLARATETLATGAGDGSTTSRSACPVTPSLAALIIAVPGATPAIIPESSTLATEALDVFHVIVRPVSTVPLASSAVAVP